MGLLKYFVDIINAKPFVRVVSQYVDISELEKLIETMTQDIHQAELLPNAYDIQITVVSDEDLERANTAFRTLVYLAEKYKEYLQKKSIAFNCSLIISPAYTNPDLNKENALRKYLNAFNFLQNYSISNAFVSALLWLGSLARVVADFFGSIFSFFPGLAFVQGGFKFYQSPAYLLNSWSFGCYLVGALFGGIIGAAIGLILLPALMFFSQDIKLVFAEYMQHNSIAVNEEKKLAEKEDANRYIYQVRSIFKMLKHHAESKRVEVKLAVTEEEVPIKLHIQPVEHAAPVSTNAGFLDLPIDLVAQKILLPNWQATHLNLGFFNDACMMRALNKAAGEEGFQAPLFNSRERSTLSSIEREHTLASVML